MYVLYNDDLSIFLFVKGETSKQFIQKGASSQILMRKRGVFETLRGVHLNHEPRIVKILFWGHP